MTIASTKALFGAPGAGEKAKALIGGRGGVRRARQRLGRASIRFASRLDPRDRELTVLAVARTLDCRYEWGAHAPEARRVSRGVTKRMAVGELTAREAGSMSRRGNCWDNAVAESFFATLKVELVYATTWETRAAARGALFEYIEVFYNGQRRHSSLGYLSPRAFERRRAQHGAAA